MITILNLIILTIIIIFITLIIFTLILITPMTPPSSSPLLLLRNPQMDLQAQDRAHR